MRGWAFAISPGDMDRFEISMRILKQIRYFNRVFEVSFIGSRTDPVKHGQAWKEVVECFLIVHFADKSPAFRGEFTC